MITDLRAVRIRKNTVFDYTNSPFVCPSGDHLPNTLNHLAPEGAGEHNSKK
jgi:hypothetical protein